MSEGRLILPRERVAKSRPQIPENERFSRSSSCRRRCRSRSRPANGAGPRCVPPRAGRATSRGSGSEGSGAGRHGGFGGTVIPPASVARPAVQRVLFPLEPAEDVGIDVENLHDGVARLNGVALLHEPATDAAGEGGRRRIGCVRPGRRRPLCRSRWKFVAKGSQSGRRPAWRRPTGGMRRRSNHSSAVGLCAWHSICGCPAKRVCR